MTARQNLLQQVVNAAFAKTGKAKTRSIGSQRSEMDPPAHVKGVEPKKPARKRKTSWAPMLGARAEAMIHVM